jgi:hypothetical protein
MEFSVYVINPSRDYVEIRRGRCIDLHFISPVLVNLINFKGRRCNFVCCYYGSTALCWGLGRLFSLLIPFTVGGTP